MPEEQTLMREKAARIEELRAIKRRKVEELAKLKVDVEERTKLL